MGYEAYVLTEESRLILMQLFPPKYPAFFGHHITRRFGVERVLGAPYGEQTTGWFEVIGYVDDGSLEALVFSVAGKEFRPDGKRYHLTWSLDPEQGRKPVQSNEAIALGFTPLNPRQRVHACLAYIEFSPRPTEEKL